MATIQSLSLPTLVGGISTGYPGYVNILKNKINELATAMSISPLTLSATLGAGSPASDFNTVVAKVNALIGVANNGTTGPSKPILVICEGDSTTQGFLGNYTVDPNLSYPGRLAVALGANFVVVNVAIGGTDTLNMLNRAQANVDSLYDPSKYSMCIYILHGGINNFYLAHNPPYTADGTLSELRQNLTARKAVGFKAFGCTVIAGTQPYEGTITTLNASLRNNWSSWGIDGLFDFRTDSLLNNPTNDGYYDSVHPNQLGYQHMAKVVFEGMRAYLAGLGIAVPSYLFPFEAPADTVAPSAPGTPVVSNVTSGGATLTWAAATDNVGVVSYDLYELDGTARGATNARSIALTNLVASTNYKIVVKARDVAGNVGPASGFVEFTTLAASTVVGLEPVTWVELANGAQVSGASLIAPASSTAYSSKVIGPSTAAIRGYIEVTWTADPMDVVFGLNSAAHQNNGYTDIQIAWYLQNGNQFKEFGTLIPPTGNRGISVGQVLRAQIEPTGVRYLIDGAEFAFYTCTVPTGSLQVDYWALGNSTLNNVKIYAANLLPA